MPQYEELGEGIITVGRGLTFLGLASEENAQKFARNIAAAQGLFDLYKGGVMIVKSLQEIQLAQAAASRASAAANTGLSASFAVVRTMAGTAASAVTTFWVALGPVGQLIAVVGAAVGAATLAWNSYTDSVEAATQASEDARREAEAAYMAMQNARMREDHAAIDAGPRRQLGLARDLAGVGSLGKSREVLQGIQLPGGKQSISEQEAFVDMILERANDPLSNLGGPIVMKDAAVAQSSVVGQRQFLLDQARFSSQLEQDEIRAAIDQKNAMQTEVERRAAATPGLEDDEAAAERRKKVDQEVAVLEQTADRALKRQAEIMERMLLVLDAASTKLQRIENAARASGGI